MIHPYILNEIETLILFAVVDAMECDMGHAYTEAYLGGRHQCRIERG